VLYGTAYSGGSSGKGAVFKLGTNGSGYAVLHHFASTNGANPRTPLLLSGSTLYGTTENGGNPVGSAPCGTVFKMETNGTGFNVLKNFSSSTGIAPWSGVTLVGNILYGTTDHGGSSGKGTIYQVNTDGTGYALLKDFSGSPGGYPRGGLVFLGGMLYGTTMMGGGSGCGILYKINTNGTGFTALKNFSPTDGSNPTGDLILVNDTLYGTTATGGPGYDGVVFALKLGPQLNASWSNGLPILKLTGDVDSKYALEYATSLPASDNWQGLVTNTLTTNTMTFTDTNSVGDTKRFYRARLMP